MFVDIVNLFALGEQLNWLKSKKEKCKKYSDIGNCFAKGNPSEPAFIPKGEVENV